MHRLSSSPHSEPSFLRRLAEYTPVVRSLSKQTWGKKAEGSHTCGLVCVLLDLTEGVHNDSQQEVEQHHEDQQLKGPEEEGCRHPLQALQLVEVIIHADITQQNGKAGVHCCAKRGELLQSRTGVHVRWLYRLPSTHCSIMG